MTKASWSPGPCRWHGQRLAISRSRTRLQFVHPDAPWIWESERETEREREIWRLRKCVSCLGFSCWHFHLPFFTHHDCQNNVGHGNKVCPFTTQCPMTSPATQWLPKSAASTSKLHMAALLFTVGQPLWWYICIYVLPVTAISFKEGVAGDLMKPARCLRTKDLIWTKYQRMMPSYHTHMTCLSPFMTDDATQLVQSHGIYSGRNIRWLHKQLQFRQRWQADWLR